ncbi:MAG: signal recognition particle protein Srp19 [Candidatus Methanospirareceae archaeon]
MKKMVIWPVYIDVTRTRAEGRKIRRRDAVKSPKITEIERVAASLGLEPEVEEEKAYPKAHWERSGRVLVKKVASKGKILRDIAEGIKRMRGKGR